MADRPDETFLCLRTPLERGSPGGREEVGDDGYVLCVECFADYLDLI